MKELLDYLGLPGSIATVFLAIMFAFGQIEKLATTTAKSDLSHFLKTANWITISSQLPKIIHELFKRVFGESHFSLKCFYRSVIFTLGSLFTLLMLGFIGNYAYFKTMPFELTYSPSFQVIFMGWLMLSVAVDYANLYKTRVLIRLVEWARLPVLSFIPLIILDLLLSLFVFMLLYGCVFSLSAAHSMCIKAHCTVWEELRWSISLFHFMSSIDQIVVRLHMIYGGPTSNEIAVFFWSGLLPTLWLALYITSIAIARILIRFVPAIRFTTYFFDVETRPIQIIGFVFAALVGIAMIVVSLIKKTW
jgi:hypothetical protein